MEESVTGAVVTHGGSHVTDGAADGGAAVSITETGLMLMIELKAIFCSSSRFCSLSSLRGVSTDEVTDEDVSDVSDESVVSGGSGGSGGTFSPSDEMSEILLELS